jgi:hypothetical protein
MDRSDSPKYEKIKVVIRMLGMVVLVICLICVKSSTDETPDAKFVVSDIGDILSPKQAPQIIAPATHGAGMPIAIPAPIRATPTVLTVVNELPTRLEMTIQENNEVISK